MNKALRRKVDAALCKFSADDLFSFFDGDCAVKSHILFTKVAEAAVVGGGGELRGGNAILHELLVNAIDTGLAQTDVNLLGAGVVVGPTGEYIVGLAVRLHYFGDSAENVAVFAGQAAYTNGIVDGGKGSLFGFNLFNRTVEAVAELRFEVGDAGIGGRQTGAEFVAVFGFGANGYNGSRPAGGVEVVGQTQICLKRAVGTVVRGHAVNVAVKTAETEVEIEVEVLVEAERVDKACAYGKDAVAAVVPVAFFVSTVALEVVCTVNRPVAACTYIDASKIWT